MKENVIEVILRNGKSFTFPGVSWYEVALDEHILYLFKNKESDMAEVTLNWDNVAAVKYE